MGTIKQGILGGFSGKVAGVVGSSWKGIAVIKSRPLSVANPRTSAQTAQRTKFAAVVAVAAAALSGLVKPLWDRFASGESGYNAFVKRNLAAFDGDGALTFPDLVASSGKMEATVISSVTAEDAETSMLINWANDSGSGLKLSSDLAYALVLDDAQNVLAAATNEDERADGTYSVALNRPLVNAETIHVYLSFKRSDGTVVSNSSYFNKTVTA